MDFWELIKTRHSVRSYDKNRPLSRELILKILEAGRLAPSAANCQPWEFVVVSSPEILDKLRKCYNKEWFNNVPHILVVKGLKALSWKRRDGYDSIETDLAIAMTFIILAAANEGVATCWIAAFDEKILREALDLKENEKVYAITPLGYPEDDWKVPASKSRKKLEDIVRFI
ncbi:MAG: nitroreductase family protein [Brevinematia bacterium]